MEPDAIQSQMYRLFDGIRHPERIDETQSRSPRNVAHLHLFRLLWGKICIRVSFVTVRLVNVINKISAFTGKIYSCTDMKCTNRRLYSVSYVPPGWKRWRSSRNISRNIQAIPPILVVIVIYSFLMLKLAGLTCKRIIEVS